MSNDEKVAQLEARVRELEILLAFEARVVEAQASLDTEGKYIGKTNKAILREQVARMRDAATGFGIVADKREYRNLIHDREKHEEQGFSGWGCTLCFEKGAR